MSQLIKKNIYYYYQTIIDDTWAKAEERMNEYLKIVTKWLAANKLSLNVDKTVVMSFGNYCDSVPQTVEIRLDNKLLNRVESHKYLGVIFDYNMKWDQHIEYIIKKTKYLIFIFAKIKNIMDTKTLLTVYYAFFNSIINYGIIAWGGAYSTCIKLIQGVQNKILKIICKNKFIKEKYPLTVRQLFQFQSILYHYKNLKEKYINSSSKTRNKNIQLPKISKTIATKNSYYVAIKIFNNLSNELKELCGSKQYVKSKLKDYIQINDQLVAKKD